MAGVFGSIDENCLKLKNEDTALSYLKGNVIELDRPDEAEYELCSDGGWLTVMYDGYPLGLGKLTGRTVKNHYPKGLRHL